MITRLPALARAKLRSWLAGPSHLSLCFVVQARQHKRGGKTTQHIQILRRIPALVPNTRAKVRHWLAIPSNRSLCFVVLAGRRAHCQSERRSHAQACTQHFCHSANASGVMYKATAPTVGTPSRQCMGVLGVVGKASTSTCASAAWRHTMLGLEK